MTPLTPLLCLVAQAADAHNPVLPAGSELAYGLIAFVLVLVPVAAVLLLAREVVRTRRGRIPSGE